MDVPIGPAFPSTQGNTATNTTNMTIVAWIYPTVPSIAANTGLVFERAPGQQNGFGFGNTANNLGYVWDNNDVLTSGYGTGLRRAD